MTIPIGTLLVRQGVITEDQRDQVLLRQRLTHRPFGQIAEEILGVDARAVEDAWAEQYAQSTRWLVPLEEELDPAVRELVTRRQAWQFGILPVRYDDSDLMVCTTRDALIRAMNFASRQIPVQCYFVLAGPDDLAAALTRFYQIDGCGLKTLAAGGISYAQRPSGGLVWNGVHGERRAPVVSRRAR